MVLFLKSEESVKVTVLQDLDSIFKLIKDAETKIFVDQTFRYNIIFYGISQHKLCSARVEQANESDPEKKLCTNLTRTFESEAAKALMSEDNFKVDGCKIHGNCN